MKARHTGHHTGHAHRDPMRRSVQLSRQCGAKYFVCDCPEDQPSRHHLALTHLDRDRISPRATTLHATTGSSGHIDQVPCLIHPHAHTRIDFGSMPFHSACLPCPKRLGRAQVHLDPAAGRVSRGSAASSSMAQLLCCCYFRCHPLASASRHARHSL